MTRTIDRINVLGVGISGITMQDALLEIEGWIRNREQQYVCVCANHVIMESRKSEYLRRTINAAGLATPDGMSVVWACKLFGSKRIRRVYGPELMSKFCALAARRGYTNFLYGGAEGQSQELAKKLYDSFPGLQIVGTRSTPFDLVDPMDDPEGIEKINQLSPDVVWVGLGAPKQELWMGKHHRHIEARVIIGVGAAFDFLSGRRSHAPHWIQQSGLEWLYRLVHNPRRLWRRNLYHFPFAYYVLLQQLGIKSIRGGNQ